MRLKASIPKKAASIVLLRPCPPSKTSYFDYEVLILRRSVTFDFPQDSMTYGSALVFPGGQVEHRIDDDYSRRYALPGKNESAALREVFEETGLFFTSKPVIQSSKLSLLNSIRTKYIANSVVNASKAIQDSFEALSQTLAPTTSMVPFIRMITVPFMKRRYDTSFFVLPLKEYKYINFFKFSQKPEYLYNLDQIQHCKNQYTDFRWLNPAEILSQYYSKKAVVVPPQFVMLNVMLRFKKHKEFVQYLRSINASNCGFNNRNMGPNIISLIDNKGIQAKNYPFAATLVGDREFPYQKILENESSDELKEEVSEWMTRSREEHGEMNRFLFQEGRRLFESQFDVQCNAPQSIIGEMRGSQEMKNTLDTIL